MHQQPGLNWSVADLAKDGGHVPFRVRRTIPGRDGNHPGKISQRAEDALAIQYIRHENQPIETVALRLGYGSLAAFSRAFKRIIGHCAGTLREASQTPEEV